MIMIILIAVLGLVVVNAMKHSPLLLKPAMMVARDLQAFVLILAALRLRAFAIGP